MNPAYPHTVLHRSAPLLFLMFVGAGLCASAQAQLPEKQYLSEVLEFTSRKNAAYYRVASGTKDDLTLAKTYTLDGVLKVEGSYADPELKVEHGDFTFYHANGKVESRGEYVMGNKAGVWMRYDQWGRPLAEKVYDPESLENIIYTRAQQMPSFPEGEKAFVRVIDQKMSGPAGDRTKGKATASFIVEKSGDLTDVKVVEGSDVQLNEKLVEAIRSTSPWNTGVEKGQPVRVQVRMPVQF